jgi:Tfp pilus assembly protein PilP
MIKPNKSELSKAQGFKKGLMALASVLALTSGCSIKSDGLSKTDWMWMQITEEQKKETLERYYSSQPSVSSPQSSAEQPQQCPEPLTALRDELTKLRAENARLQAKLQKKSDEVVITMPPAF